MTISKNKHFENIVLKYKSHYDIMLNKSLKYVINLNSDHISNQSNEITIIKNNKTREYNFINIGIIKNNQFIWFDLDTRDLLYEHFKKYQFIENGYVTHNYISKFFSSSFKVNKKNKYFIIYLLSIINPGFNIIRFSTEDNNIKYIGMIPLKIKDNFNYNDFVISLQNHL